MYQSACCLVNWAEVSRQHVSARQEEGGGQMKRNRVLESSRPHLCCAGFERSPWIRWRRFGGVLKSQPPLLCGAMGKALICFHCAAKTSPLGCERIKALSRQTIRYCSTQRLLCAVGEPRRGGGRVVFSGLAVSEGTFTMVGRIFFAFERPSKRLGRVCVGGQWPAGGSFFQGGFQAFTTSSP